MEILDHHDHPEASGERKRNRKALALALALTGSLMLAEVIGGWLANSLALLSDAGHMFSDTLSLALSLYAMWVANRPPDSNKTFGYYRFEILAAFLNGLTLIGIAVYILFEAFQRLLHPQNVAGVMMMVIAAFGLLVNVASAWMLMRGNVKENLNLRSAFLHVLGDLIGSVGAIVAGLLILFYGWNAADPLISAVIAVLVLISGVRVTRQSFHILMEGSPKNFDSKELRAALLDIPQVVNVHEIHCWTITSDFHSLSCHLEIEKEADDRKVLQTAKKLIEKRFGIKHTTVQLERSDS